jgi:hypothetical protein
VLTFEQGLRRAAAAAVGRITNATLRQEYSRMLPTLRLPYWWVPAASLES